MLGREAAERATKSGGYWINKTKDFSESLNAAIFITDVQFKVIFLIATREVYKRSNIYKRILQLRLANVFALNV